MIGRGWRRLLHATHAAATLLLLATGLLILSPDLRARLVGGYGRQIAELHGLFGWAFVLVPAVALLPARRALLADLRERLGRQSPRPGWPRLHLLVTLAASAAAGVTGLALLADLPAALFDAARAVHVAAHYALLGSLPLHLFLARRAIADRILLWLGREPAPLFEWADDGRGAGEKARPPD